MELCTTAYLRLLFLSSSYPKTQPLAPEKQERPICNSAKDRVTGVLNPNKQYNKLLN